MKGGSSGSGLPQNSTIDCSPASARFPLTESATVNSAPNPLELLLLGASEKKTVTATSCPQRAIQVVDVEDSWRFSAMFDAGKDMLTAPPMSHRSETLFL